MVSEGRGRLFRRSDGKYLIYLPVYLCQDSMFPFKDWVEGARGGAHSVSLEGSFIMGEKKLVFTRTQITKKETVGKTVSARCRLFARKDGKYLIYLSKDWSEDSMFPFKGSDSILVKVSFKPDGGEKLVAERWVEPVETD